MLACQEYKQTMILVVLGRGLGMVRPVSIDRAVSQLHRWLFVSERAARVMTHRLLSILATGFFISWLTMTSFVATASAIEANVSNDSFSALSDFARSIDVAPKPTGAIDQNSSNTAPNESMDATIAALREFSRQIEPSQTKSARGPAEIGRRRQPARFFAPGRFFLTTLRDAKRIVKRQRANRRRDETNRARRSQLCGRESLRDLPCNPG